MIKKKTFIGFVDTPKDENQLNDDIDLYPYETKIGGSPVWCAQPPIEYQSLKCINCNHSLAFLLQAYCPLDSIPDYERNYYIFVCQKCSNKQNGWKVIKCLDPLKESSINDDEEERQEEEEKKHKQEFKVESDWGVDDQSWDDNDNSSSSKVVEEKEISLADLIKNRDKDLLDKSKQQQKKVIKNLKESFNSENEIISGIILNNDSSNQYEPFYLFIEEEKFQKKKTITTNSNSLKDYEFEEEGDEAGGWSNETYEYVKDRIFSKFLKKIGDSPDQCLRYSFGGEPLVMTSQGQDLISRPPTCKRCGKTKVFEFQILSTLITQIQLINNKSGVAEENGGGGALDFGNVFIFTCPSVGCLNHGNCWNDVLYDEEVVLIEGAI